MIFCYFFVFLCVKRVFNSEIARLLMFPSGFWRVNRQYGVYNRDPPVRERDPPVLKPYMFSAER